MCSDTEENQKATSFFVLKLCTLVYIVQTDIILIAIY